MTVHTGVTRTGPELRARGSRVAPLSFAQQRLWMIDAAAPGSVTYHVPLLLRWLAPVDAECLSVALTAVVAKHEILRTTYQVRADLPVQVVGESAPVPVEVLDPPRAEDVEQAVLGAAHARAREPFDLAAGPLLRCRLWPGVPGGDRVLLLLHHIAIDGWSLVALFEDLAQAYEAALAGRPAALRPLPVQYGDFARWDHEVLATDDMRRQLARRVDELLTVDARLTLTGARPAPPRALGDRPGRQHTVPVPAAVWSSVHRTATALRATPFVVLLAAYQQTLSQWSGREDFVIGAITANRPHPDLERLIGYFVATVPLRCRVRAGQSFAELATEARAEGYRSLTLQRLPYDQLAATAAVTVPGGHGRVQVNVGFALQNMPTPDIAAPPWAPPTLLFTGSSRFDLLLIVEERDEGPVCVLEYDTDVYPADLVRRFASDFLTRLAAGADDPDIRLRPGSPIGTTAPERVVEPAEPPTVADPSAVELFTTALAEVRREVPGSGQLGPESNFFALGGNSMLAMSMLARAQRLHGVSAAPREFLSEPTVAGLGRLLAATATEPPAWTEPAVGNDPDHSAGRHPATPSQQRFWAIDRIASLRTSYVVPTVLRLDGDVDRAALASASDLVLSRHPALRSRFELDRRLRRVCYRTDGPAAATTLVDATDWDDHTVRAQLAAVCGSGFDLATGPVARARIVVLPGRTLFVLVVHHIVTDGWSQRLLLDQLAEAYRARIDGRPARLADPVHPARVSGTPDPTVDDRTEDAVARLRGAPTDVELPRDRPRPGDPCVHGAVHSVSLDVDVTRRLRAIGADQACSTFMMAGALLAAGLARQGDQRDFLMAFPFAGRDGPESANAVGLFVDTLVLRVDLSGVRTWRALLVRARTSSAAAYRGANVPFDRLAAALHPDRDLSRPPVTPLYLSAVDGTPDGPSFGPHVVVRDVPPEPLRIKYELEMTAVDEPTRLRLEFAYAVELFDPDTVCRLAAHVVAAATDLVTDLDAHPLGGTS
jgi:non-ribosomal peptide synthetase component F